MRVCRGTWVADRLRRLSEARRRRLLRHTWRLLLPRLQLRLLRRRRLQAGSNGQVDALMNLLLHLLDASSGCGCCWRQARLRRWRLLVLLLVRRLLQARLLGRHLLLHAG